MKKLSTLLLFLVFNATVIAQASFGFKINGGVSMITDKIYDPNIETHTNYFKPSGQVGFFYNLPLRTDQVFGVELLFTQIESKEKIVDTLGTAYTNYPNGAIPLLSTYTISKHISYLSLPVHYGINVRNFTFNVGMQFSVRLLSSAQEIEQDSYTNNASGYGFVLTPSTTTYNYKKLSIKDVDFGQTVGIIYHFTNNIFAIEGNYYYGFNNIYPNTRRTTEWRTQQITLGIRYTFFKRGCQIKRPQTT
jgi:hypothetical protein